MAIAQRRVIPPPAHRPDVDPEFPGKVIRFRRRQGWRQRDMAEAVKTTPTTVANWEAGRTAPIPGPLLIRLASVMRTNPAELLYGEKED